MNSGAQFSRLYEVSFAEGEILVEKPAQRVERRVEISMLFRLVRDDVVAATKRRQEPFTYGSLPGEDFYFSVK